MNQQGYRPGSRQAGGILKGNRPSMAGGQAQYRPKNPAGAMKNVQRSFQRGGQNSGYSGYAGRGGAQDMQAGGNGTFANDYQSGSNFPSMDARSRQIKKEPYERVQRPAFQQPYDPEAANTGTDPYGQPQQVRSRQPTPQPTMVKKSPLSFQQAVAPIKQEQVYQSEMGYQPEQANFYGGGQGYQSQPQQQLASQAGFSNLIGGAGADQPLEGDQKARAQYFYKTKMCPHFPYGKCMRGNQCNFAHSDEELRSLPNLQKTKMCLLFIQGNCQMGDQCTYAHGKSELRATPEFYKTSLCHQYMQGFCKLGDRCRFAHGDEELRPRTLPPLANQSQMMGAGYMDQGSYVNDKCSSVNLHAVLLDRTTIN